MKKRYAAFAAWLIMACLLYFFENNTGTRIVLAASWLLPILPAVRRGLFERDAVTRPLHADIPQAGRTSVLGEVDGPGNVRDYLPGDPVNRIHWKLSAKRDALLVREPEEDRGDEEAEVQAVFKPAVPAVLPAKRRPLLICLSVFLFSMVLLFSVPSANQGMQALLNRLFDASEAVNAYAYMRFAVPANQSFAWTMVLLSVMGLSLLGIMLLAGSRWPILCGMAGSVLFQTYFGLSFPGWINVLLFAAFVLRMMNRPRARQTVTLVLAGISVLSLAVSVLYPGVDAETESASETVRDRLSQMVQAAAGSAREMPAGETETRHVYPQSLTEGSREARPDRTYRLLTVDEEQISRPHWISYLRIVLLLLLTVALVALPFLPFLVLNRQRKKALDARKAFQSENVSVAVFAIFQHVTAWLEATGYGTENALYAAWQTDFSPEYAARFAACEKLFEEAAYSHHEMREEHRQQALALLTETEQVLQQRAGLRQRLRLKYKECLWV